MEKRGVIEEGRTPPEEEKQGGSQDKFDDPVRRASGEVEKKAGPDDNRE